MGQSCHPVITLRRVAVAQMQMVQHMPQSESVRTAAQILSSDLKNTEAIYQTPAVHTEPSVGEPLRLDMTHEKQAQ